ncbi:hypothetical protein DA096_08695 [Vibrio rotiferianus]|uniref:hypothetical protein n=1 Tax=Vibrio rotiferianus TaxID=190895 RepID=UPI0011103EAF|nr:hypothetical protein [Vibrio rotiferianus]TMX33840.1 hypothetical protein DA095_16275 [Vibrio rotiferianus]TMX55316.1 hypothetical protein DA093_08190 [Vibrio rotiferianus]TMX66260.1 hypothetical protein DA096_08695 [Vibrio rotiferianus]
MSNKLYLKSKSGTVLLAIKVQNSPKRQFPIYGESDVIIECSRKDRIDGLINVNFGRHLFSNVTYVSWHGFYSYKNNQIINPVVKFHSKNGIKEFRHKGVICKSEQFAFPIATFFLDANKTVGFQKNINRNYQQLLFDRSAIDIFILPKGITFHDYLKTSVSIFFLIAEMSVYNPVDNCEFIPIKIGDMLFYHQTISGRVVLLRERELPKDFVVPNGVGSIFHDPNAPLESLVDRYISYDGDNLELFRPRYDEERI